MKLNRGFWRELDSLLLLAASALAIGAVIMLFDLNKELEKSQTIFNDDLPSYSVRAELDLAMIISNLNKFMQGGEAPDDVLERYEVFIARLHHYESAFLTEYAEPNPEFHRVIERLKAVVLDREDMFYSLEKNDVDVAATLRDELVALRPELATLSNLTRKHQFLQYQIIDESLAHSVFVGTLMLASTLILGALTVARFWYSLREKTRFNEELEAKIQARTRDLQLSNNELKKEMAERQKAEKSLAERDQQMHRVQKMEAVGRITAGVAHDFNNLLAVIMGNIELQMTLDEKGKSGKFLDNAMSASVMGSQLTRKLLAFGRRSPLKPEVIDLNQVASELDDLFMQTISEKSVLEMDLAEDLRHVSVDRSLLENVVLNLVINARDALPDGGVITIKTENITLERSSSEEDGRLLPAGEYVQLTVSDTGLGMSAEVLDQAIEPFFTTKSETEGSGLGLSMAYGFVQQSNGQLRVSSTLGEGTSVSLLFPSSNEKLAKTQTAAHSYDYQPAGYARRVLVAEDSDAVRRTVVEQLRLLGCETVEAASGQEAYELVKGDCSIDLLLTDVVMPGALQGPELAERVLKMNPDMKIVFMSGYPKGMDQSVDGPNGAFTKLMKPISLSMLSQTLRNEFDDNKVVEPA